MQGTITLTITEGSLKGKQFVFGDRTTCVIGRAIDCHPQLPDDDDHKTISRYHCLLDINPPNIRIRDFGSKNGTYVNGKKIGQRHPETTPEQRHEMYFPEYDLMEGDEIKLGNTVFRVSIHSINLDSATDVMVAVKPVEEKPVNLQPVVQVINAEANALVFGHYVIVKLLGKGGFGEVYLAQHQLTGERVALKVMRPQIAANPRSKELFLRETENTKALKHPNVVQLRDYGYHEDTFFFTLEYCDGGSVTDLIKQRGGRLLLDEAIQITLQALEGLEYAHNAEIHNIKLKDGSIGTGRGLVHRDVKPSNLLLSYTDSNRMTKVADYGLAKAFDQAGLSGLSMSGSTSGTPHFMPRQQVINFKYAKPEVDVWAIAASLYYMITGNFPRNFVGDPFLAVLQTDAVPIRDRDRSVPQQLAELIDLALRDKPEIYFKSAADFKQALLSCV